MPHYVIAKVATSLNEDAKAVRGSRVLVLGVAYKGDISDVRESPALDLIKLLIESGANLAYHDPYVPAVKVNGTTIRSVDLTDAELAAADCVVIETNHSIFDWDHIGASTRNIVDTRNAMASTTGEPRARVVKL
jgi:UDP-N-acetyl-D-glucosamine dehydrogenase